MHLNLGSILRTLVAGFVLLLSMSSALSQEVFMAFSMEDSVIKARESDRRIYVFGTTQWCDACTEMKNKTLANEAVQKRLNASFIAVTIDLETEEGINFAVKYRAAPAPQHLIFDGDGQLTHRAKGFLTSKEFLEFLTSATDSTTPALAPLPKPLDFVMDYPEWYREYRKSPSKRTVPTEQEITSFLNSRDSITDEVTWAVLYSLPAPPEYIDKIVKNKQVLSERYGKEEVLEKLSGIVYDQVKSAIKNHDEAKLHMALCKADQLLGSDAEIYKMRYRLYYYQYHKEWGAYANAGNELAQNPKIKDNAWLNEIAQNIYNETTNEKAMAMAIGWMYPIIETTPTYEYILTTARLKLALGDTEKAGNLLKDALEFAQGKREIRVVEEMLLKLNMNE